MADLIFNKATDPYIFTGSRLRAPPSRALRLSSANNESIIDLCNNGIVDISASSVFINGLQVVTTSNGNATTLTSLQLAQNLDVSGLITSDGGIQIGSGSYGGKIYKTANLYELVIDPFGLDPSSNFNEDTSGQVIVKGNTILARDLSINGFTHMKNAYTSSSLGVGGDLYAYGNVNITQELQIGSGSYGGKIYKTAKPNELVIDPFTIDASNNISDASGQVTIMGDLVVYGNTTTISSTNVDISDVKLTLASGGASGNVNGAGIQLGNDGYASMLWDSSTQRWFFNKGVDISGSVNITNSFGLTVGGFNIIYDGVRPVTNYGRVATTLSSFKIKYGPDLGSDISTAFSNVWRDASGWDLTYGVYPMSLYSRMKIEARITYTSSPEADQTLSFKIVRFDGISSYDVCSDISLGTNMGVTFNGVHTMMFYHDLATFNASSTIRYRLQFMRNCPANDTITTPFGIQASSSNIMSLQEIVSPQAIV